MDYMRAFQELLNREPGILRERKPPKNIMERLRTADRKPTRAEREKAAADARLAPLKAATSV